MSKKLSQSGKTYKNTINRKPNKAHRKQHFVMFREKFIIKKKPKAKNY
jgi:hypothetical protein